MPKPIDLLVTGGFILTMDPNYQTYFPGSVAIHQGVIVHIGLSKEVDRHYLPGQTLQADQHVVLPGLINLHGHASNSLIRGLGNDLPLDQWLKTICWPCMAFASETDIFNGALLSAAEMLLNGITTFADMWTNVGQTARAVAQTGQRAVVAHNIKDFGDLDRGEKELQAALLAKSQWHGFADGRVSVGLAPHSVYTCSLETLARIGQLTSLEPIHIQIHASETLREVEECKARYSCTPIELLAEVDLLSPNTLIAHAVHLTENDIHLIKSSGASIAHNVCSNFKLASGIAPIYRYLAEGICVGIGTDGPGSNDSLNMLGDLKTAILVQKAISGDATTISNLAALEMVTTQGARALGFSDQIGTLEQGKAADLITLDFNRPHLKPFHYDFPSSILSHLVFSASGTDVDSVIINGKLLVKEGKLVSLDIDKIKSKAQESSRKILKAANLI